MRTSAVLNAFLPTAPAAPCSHYKAGDVALCAASGKAKNGFPLKCKVAAVALETDDATYRFPPERDKLVCDWCVFTVEEKEKEHRGCFIELKGSDFIHALKQLTSTMDYMKRYRVVPTLAITALSGAHPRNALPAKANAILRFRNRFGFPPRERSAGQAKKGDVLE